MIHGRDKCALVCSSRRALCGNVGRCDHEIVVVGLQQEGKVLVATRAAVSLCMLLSSLQGEHALENDVKSVGQDMPVSLQKQGDMFVAGEGWSPVLPCSMTRGRSMKAGLLGTCSIVVAANRTWQPTQKRM